MAMDKTFDAATAEARISREWIEGGYFRAGANASRPETFSVMIPPPNVNGSLHVGHAFNNTLQDILTRWHRMRGFRTLWQPGQDHAGIALQLAVEKELAKDGRQRRDMTRDDFLAYAWDYKQRTADNIVDQLKRLGASCDWERNAFTMSGAPGAPAGEEGNFHDAVIKVFVEMYEKGLIYRGKRLVNWDPHFETAISDLEVENIETPGHMWHFKYPLAGGATYEYVERDAEGEILFTETRDYISIATTRPETMLGDGAVAVHPSDARYAPIVGQLCEIPVGPKESRRLIPIITDEYPDKDFGSGAVKITGAHDFNDYAVAKRGNIPCYRLMDTKAAMRADGAPYAEAAAIAMAVAQGERMLSAAEVDAINLVPDHLRGLDRFDARAKVVEEITAEGLAVMVPATDPRLGASASPSGAASPSSSGSTRGSQAAGDARVEPGHDGTTGTPPLDAAEGGEMRTEDDQLVPLVEPKPIMQPHGDRSKVVIEPMLTDQWFVETDKIVGPALDAVRDGTIEIVPESDRKVYFHWLENIEPWCISRQLWWGHQVPVFYVPRITPNPKSSDLRDAALDWDDPVAFCAANEDAARLLIARHLESLGVHWEYFHSGYNGITQVRIEFEDLDENGVPVWRDPDVLDTWFSSGLWPLGTLGWPERSEELDTYFPTSTLITGTDILFFWVARMIMMQLAVLPDETPLKDRIPFEKVYLHGLVRDAKGKKMSKSVGNVVDPLELIDEYGADALRFANAAMASLGGALKLDPQRIAGYRNFGTKLWNAVRFAEMNGATFGADATPNARLTVNRWIIGETARTRAEVDAALDAYRFDDAAAALYRFVWNVVCDWYVEFSKPILQGEEAAAKAETQAVMGWVLGMCMTMMHPIMPFITEELWGATGHDGMLVHGTWPEDLGEDAIDPAAETEIRWVIAFIEAIRSARAQMNVPASARIPVIAVGWSAEARSAYETNAAMIAALARVETLTEGDAPKGSIAVTAGADRFALPLGDVIDVAAERSRLDKQVTKLEKEIKGLSGRANNPKFAESAPPEVVEETRANLAARQSERDAVQRALDSLNELA
ncbi:valine--tRNA ligase [Jannaschia marina]|uniref:valine--tRNA ligase n=1 Tax=Jannaschia marina TaxID=2741674 RepID=UPI0015CDF5DA|nr:valine--tRNA ligase [Jannaschia marina]